MLSELVTVAEFRDLPAAGLAQSILESADIPCFLDNQYTVGVNWLYSNAVGGVKLKVNKSNIERASKLLEVQNKPIEFSGETEDGLLSDSACPNCGDTDLAPINHKRRFAAFSLLLMFPLIFFGKRYRCNKCGHKFK